MTSISNEALERAAVSAENWKQRTFRECEDHWLGNGVFIDSTKLLDEGDIKDTFG